MIELKEKFEFIERIADLKTHEDCVSSEFIFIGDKSKKLREKNIIQAAFFDLKKSLTKLNTSKIEIQFDSINFQKIEDLENSVKELKEVVEICSKIFQTEDVCFLVEVNLDYDLEVFISGESLTGLRDIKTLQGNIPKHKNLRITPRLYGQKGNWKSFVLKCDLEKYEVNEINDEVKRIEA
jgi:hypothetical protein